MKNGKRCTKCGQPLIKNEKYGRFCLDGYSPKEELCAGCNATESVVKRLNDGGDISIEECKALPRTLIFDPDGDNLQEEYMGRRFQKIVDWFMKDIAQETAW